MTRDHVLTALGLLGILAAVCWPSGPDDPAQRREDALTLVGQYLPCSRGDAHYREVCKDFGGSGTTCGYLPGFLWYRLGCRDNRLVNRSEPQDGLTYHNAQNIACVVNGGKAVGAWRDYHPGQAPPEPGDVLYFQDALFISGASTNPREHVAMCVAFDAASGSLTTYDLGHSPDPEGNLVTRQMNADGSIAFMGSTRKIVGIVDLTLVPMSAPADLTDHTLGVA